MMTDVQDNTDRQLQEEQETSGPIDASDGATIKEVVSQKEDDKGGGTADVQGNVSANSAAEVALQLAIEHGFASAARHYMPRQGGDPNLSDWTRIFDYSRGRGLGFGSILAPGLVAPGKSPCSGPKCLPVEEISLFQQAASSNITKSFWNTSGLEGGRQALHLAALSDTLQKTQRGIGTNFGWIGSLLLSVAAGYAEPESGEIPAFIDLHPGDWGDEAVSGNARTKSVWSGRDGYGRCEFYPVSILYFAELSAAEIVTVLWCYSCFASIRIRLYVGGSERRDLGGILRYTRNPFAIPELWDDPSVERVLYDFVPVPGAPKKFGLGSHELPEGSGYRDGVWVEKTDDDASESGSEGPSEKSSGSGKNGGKALAGIRWRKDIRTKDLWSLSETAFLEGMVKSAGDMDLDELQEAGAGGWRWFCETFAALEVTTQSVLFHLTSMLGYASSGDGKYGAHNLRQVSLSALRIGEATKATVGNIDPIVEFYFQQGLITADGTVLMTLPEGVPFMATRTNIQKNSVLGCICIMSDVDRLVATGFGETLDHTRAWGGVPCGSLEIADREYDDQEGWRSLVEEATADMLPGKYMVDSADLVGEDGDAEWLVWDAACCPDRVEPCLYSLLHHGESYAAGSEPPPLDRRLMRVDSVMRTDYSIVREEPHSAVTLEVAESPNSSPTYLSGPGKNANQRDTLNMFYHWGGSKAVRIGEFNAIRLVSCPDDVVLQRNTIGTLPVQLRYNTTPHILYESADGDSPLLRSGLKSVLSAGAYRAPKVSQQATLGNRSRFKLRGGANPAPAEHQ
jgi:hypothetical protein